MGARKPSGIAGRDDAQNTMQIGFHMSHNAALATLTAHIFCTAAKLVTIE
jgi:hypothetical protein